MITRSTYSSSPYGKMRDRITEREKKEKPRPKQKVGFNFRY